MKTKQRNLQETEYTRRQFLVYEQTICGNKPWWEADQTVTTRAQRQPQVDMDEKFTWREWRDHFSVKK